MKTTKYLILVIFLLLLIACSIDNNSTSTSSIIGAWQPLREVDVCSNEPDEVSELSSCSKTGRFIFLDNGNFTSTTYSINGSGNCELEISDNGTWELSGNRLFISDDNGTLREVGFFELDDNTLRAGEFDNEFCNGGYYYTEFQKVN